MAARRVSVGLVLAAGLAAGGGWLWLRATEKDRVIAEQRRVIAALEQKLDRAWASELVGDLRVDGVDPARQEVTVTFFQYAPGTEIPTVARTMTLPGSEVYIDALVVSFDRKLVEAGDGLKGKSLLLFRRAFGDLQKPADGVPLFARDAASPIPEVAQVDATPTAFERELWARFWEYAGDPRRAAEAGIRLAQGEAPHVKVVPGQVYKLTLRSSGGLEIQPRLPAAVTGGLKSQP
jgi:hypothetical protein